MQDFSGPGSIHYAALEKVFGQPNEDYTTSDINKRVFVYHCKDGEARLEVDASPGNDPQPWMIYGIAVQNYGVVSINGGP